MKYSKEKNQETILAISLGLLVIWYFTQIKILITTVVVLVFIGLFFQSLAGWISWTWLKLSHALGWVMSKVILSVIFFLFLFPIAMLSRLFTKDEMMIRNSKRVSFYKERNHLFKAKDLENPW